LYSLSGDIPRDQFRFFNPDAKTFDDVLREPDALPPWLSAHDLDVFVGEFERKGTFRHGINWYRCIDLNWELTAPFAGLPILQPALFIGADHDVILGQTREGVAATMFPATRFPVPFSGSKDCANAGAQTAVATRTIPINFFMAHSIVTIDDKQRHQ